MQTNEKPQHTPGPWRSVPSTAHVGGISIRQDVVTDALPFAPSFIAGDMMPEDARLIAAAPELLAALDAICDQLQGARIYLDGLIDLSAALAAMAKATGDA